MRPNTSPMEYLTVFSIVFAAGFLSAVSVIGYVERVRRNAVLDHYKWASSDANLPASPFRTKEH
jgi:hypothetical protein